MCAHRLIDKLSSVEQASQTRRAIGGGSYGNLHHSTNFGHSFTDKNGVHHPRNDSSINLVNSNRDVTGSEEVLSEEAQTLPQHIILKTNFRKLNAQTPFFRCPEWADLPPVAFHLHCARDGVALPSFNLHRYAFYLFGKNAAVCDYILQHPSISNVHAALVFHRQQECFVVVDLHSTNGVRVKRTRIPSQKPTPITVGSIIQFGYSTRLYELRQGSAPSSSSEKATVSFTSDINKSKSTKGDNNESKQHENKEYEKTELIAKRSRDDEESDNLEQRHTQHRRQQQEQQREYNQELQLLSKEQKLKTAHEDDNSTTTYHTNEIKSNITSSASNELSKTIIQEIKQNNSATMPPSALSTEDTSCKVIEEHAHQNQAQVHEQPCNHAMAGVHNGTASQEHESICSAHLYQLVIKHKDVDNPVSRGAHNKGEVITRSKEDARALAMHILHCHNKGTHGVEGVKDKNAFVPWTVEEFVSAVLMYCEVSSAKKKGNLGVVTKGTFTEEFDKVAFALRRNEVGGPVETQIGIHLIYRSD